MKRRRTAELTLGIVTTLCGLCAACTERDVVLHPGLDAGSQAEDGFEEFGSSFGGVFTSGSTDGQPVGNFPEPAISLCGSVPDGVDPIAGLTSAWAVAGAAPGKNLEGMDLPDDEVRLRFGDFAFGCDEPFVSPLVGGPCEQHWAFALSLPLDGLAPGVIDLAAQAGLFPEVHMDDSCAGGEIGGGGGEPGAEPAGELELFTVTEDCIVGELRGITDDWGTPDLDRNGGFVAMRCDSDCVPVVGNSCDQ